MEKYSEYSAYDSVSDSKLEFGAEYIIEDSHNGSDPSTSKDSSGFSMIYPVY
jgi:hypothetical protein